MFDKAGEDMADSYVDNVMNFDNRNSCISKTENHSEFRKSKGNKTDNNKTDYSNASNRKRYGNSYFNYHQRDYDFDELERILLTNPIIENVAEEKKNFFDFFSFGT